MAGPKESAETRHGLELLAQGKTREEAARLAGVAPSTLWRALQRRKKAEPASSEHAAKLTAKTAKTRAK
jgi:hypothetical protein